MRIALISDVHGNLPGLEASLEFLDSLGTDQIVCLGDLVHYGPYPSEVVDLINDRRIDTVQGNCDRAVGRGRDSTGDDYPNVQWQKEADEVLEWTCDQIDMKQKKYLGRLPFSRRYRIGSTRILCVHGTPANISASVRNSDTPEVHRYLLKRNDCDVLAAGHTHDMLLYSRNDGMIANPGSVGGGTLPGTATIAVLEVDENRPRVSVCWHRIPFDTGRYRAKYSEENLPETFLKCVLLGRDPRGEWHARGVGRRQKWAEPLSKR